MIMMMMMMIPQFARQLFGSFPCFEQQFSFRVLFVASDGDNGDDGGHDDDDDDDGDDDDDYDHNDDNI